MAQTIHSLYLSIRMSFLQALPSTVSICSFLEKKKRTENCLPHIGNKWWLPRCHSSVAEHWHLKLCVLGLIPGVYWSFHFPSEHLNLIIGQKITNCKWYLKVLAPEDDYLVIKRQLMMYILWLDLLMCHNCVSLPWRSQLLPTAALSTNVCRHYFTFVVSFPGPDPRGEIWWV